MIPKTLKVDDIVRFRSANKIFRGVIVAFYEDGVPQIWNLGSHPKDYSDMNPDTKIQVLPELMIRRIDKISYTRGTI